MLKRLGEVVYWGACGLAALISLVGLYGSRTVGSDYDLWTIAAGIAAAMVVWLVGRGTRYVLAGY